MNRTLLERTRAMLRTAGLAKSFWAEAVNTACYVQNRVLIVKTKNKTPYELWFGYSPLVKYFKIFENIK